MKMSKKFEVHYSLNGSLMIDADTESEAREKLLSSDYTETEELFEGVRLNIIDAGNDAIDISDVVEVKD